jgi:hypothetical protein
MRRWYIRDLLMPLAAGGGTGIALRVVVPGPSDTIGTLPVLLLSLAAIVVSSSVAAEFVRGQLIAQLRLALGKS